MPEISIQPRPFLCRCSRNTCCQDRSRKTTPISPECCQDEPVVYTCSEKGTGSITQPGLPQLGCLAVDPVFFSWELILGVEVMIAHGCVDLNA